MILWCTLKISCIFCTLKVDNLLMFFPLSLGSCISKYFSSLIKGQVQTLRSLHHSLGLPSRLIRYKTSFSSVVQHYFKTPKPVLSVLFDSIIQRYCFDGFIADVFLPCATFYIPQGPHLRHLFDSAQTFFCVNTHPSQLFQCYSGNNHDLVEFNLCLFICFPMQCVLCSLVPPVELNL